MNNRHIHRHLTAMARHAKEGAQAVLALLQRDYSGFDESLMTWLEPRVVQLAGRMKLKAAVPLLLDWIEEDDEDLQQQIGQALTRIGGDFVIKAIVQKWGTTDPEGKFTLTEALDCIHSDLAVVQTMRLMEQEEDTCVREGLAFAAGAQFATECIEPVRQVLREEETQGSGDYWDLRHRLVAVTTIMEERFPEYEEWHAEALATDYGWETIKGNVAPFRLADSYTEETVRITLSNNSQHTQRVALFTLASAGGGFSWRVQKITKWNVERGST